jgi:hypothetical protein
VVGACRASRKLWEYRNKIRVCADSLERPADQTATEIGDGTMKRKKRIPIGALALA